VRGFDKTRIAKIKIKKNTEIFIWAGRGEDVVTLGEIAQM
jgi:hypothetical protein